MIGEDFKIIYTIKNHRLAVEPARGQKFIGNAARLQAVNKWFGLTVGAHQDGKIVPSGAAVYLFQTLNFVHHTPYLVLQRGRVYMRHGFVISLKSCMRLQLFVYLKFNLQSIGVIILDGLVRSVQDLLVGAIVFVEHDFFRFRKIILKT